MRPTSPIAIAALTLPALAQAAFAQAAPAQPAQPIAPALVSAKETRLWENEDAKAPQEDGVVAFSTFGNDAALTLTLRVELPPGSELLEVRQPKAITATDDKGNDLTAIAKGFSGEREHFRRPAFGGNSDFFLSDEEKAEKQTKPVPQDLELVLIPAARNATTFSVRCDGALVIATGTQNVDLPQVAAWTPIAHPAFAGTKAQYRVQREGDSFTVEFKPDEARERIKDVAIAQEGDAEPATSNGYMAMMGTTTYSFSDPAPASAKIRFIVHQNLREVAMKVDLKDAKLP